MFAFQLSFSVRGLIYRCITVERAGKFALVFLLVLFARLLNSAIALFPLDEVFLRSRAAFVPINRGEVFS